MLTHATSLNPKGELSNASVIQFSLAKMGREIPTNTDNSDDYGPQRFCKHCGIKLVDVYDYLDDEAIWTHPENDCVLVNNVCFNKTNIWEKVYVIVDPEDMRVDIANHDHMTMDDLRNIYKLGLGKNEYHHNHKLVKGNWLKDNAKILHKIYNYVDVNGEDPESGHKVYTKARFMEEVNDDKGNIVVNETSATDIGISCEEKTHESFKRLRFWERMVWMIGHCPDIAYDKAIENMDGETVTDDEAIWVTEVTQGMRNNGMMRYAQYRMMEARKCRANQLNYNGFVIEFKGVDLHTFAHMFKFNYNKTKERRINCKTHGCANRIKPPKFSKVTMKVEPSERFEKFVILDFYFYGNKVNLMKGKTATNWINKYNLNHKDMNEAIDWARAELTKK